MRVDSPWARLVSSDADSDAFGGVTRGVGVRGEVREPDGSRERADERAIHAVVDPSDLALGPPPGETDAPPSGPGGESLQVPRDGPGRVVGRVSAREDEPGGRRQGEPVGGTSWQGDGKRLARGREREQLIDGGSPVDLGKGGQGPVGVVHEEKDAANLRDARDRAGGLAGIGG